jgi:RNA polymerase sigma factor (sigma-70 family)
VRQPALVQENHLAAVPSTGRADRVESSLVPPEATATQSLYERYANQIFGYCLHQLGSREEAEDAVQSTFLNAFRGFRRGVVPEQESAWLFKIAHNVCLSRRRSTWRRGRIESPADFEVVEEVTPAPSTRADELMGLQDVLEQMPDSQRRAILLREWQGLSYREIADELELSQAAVETLIFRARRTLAQGLEQPPEPARVSWRRRVRTSANIGGLLTWVKSLLVGATAAKVAGTAAVVAVSSIAATGPLERHPRHATSAAPVAPKRVPPRSRGAAAVAIVPVAAADMRLDRPRTTAPELAPASSSKRRSGQTPKHRVALLQTTHAARPVVATPAPAPAPAPESEPPAAATPPDPVSPAPPAQEAAPAQTPRPQRPAAAATVQRRPSTKQSNEDKGARKDAKKSEKEERGGGATTGNGSSTGSSSASGKREKDRGNGSGKGNGKSKSAPAATVPPATPVTTPVAPPPGEQTVPVDSQSVPQASPQPAPAADAAAVPVVEDAHGNGGGNGTDKDGEHGNAGGGSNGKDKAK